jgi:hypothetical protein
MAPFEDVPESLFVNEIASENCGAKKMTEKDGRNIFLLNILYGRIIL